MDNFYSDTSNPRSHTQSPCLNDGTIGQICCVYVTECFQTMVSSAEGNSGPSEVNAHEFLTKNFLSPTLYFKTKIEQIANTK